MPVYRLNNETYNIPDDVVSDFEKDNPSASISYMDGSDEYEIPLNKRDGFLKAFPEAKLKSDDYPPRYSQRPNDTIVNTQSQTDPQSDYASLIESGQKRMQEYSGEVLGTDAVSNSIPSTSIYQPKIENPRPVNTERDMEERIIDRRVERLGKLPEKSDKDVLDNYASRYGLTEEGANKQAEIDRKHLEVSERLVQEYLKSEEYKELASRYKGDELNEKANQEFNRLYNGKIGEELAPMYEDYRIGVLNRYGEDIKGGLHKLAKEDTENQVTSLKEEIKQGLEAAYGEWSSKQSEYESNHPVLSALSGVRSGNNTRVAAPTDDRKFSNWYSAMNLLDESEKMIAEANKKGSPGALLRGMRNGVFDVDAWTSGITDMIHGSSLQIAAEKAEREEELAPEEKKLLEAAAVNMATNAYFASDLSRSYRAGQTAGGSIPFTLGFLLNPVSGSGNAIAKGILKYGAKRFGLNALKSSVVRNGLKMGSRLVGDAVAATAMTATTGIGKVVAGANERMIGDVKFDFNEDGKIGYAGRENQMGAGEATFKSFVSNTLENQSEMFFNAFSGGGKIFGDYVKKVFPGIERFSSSELGTLYNGLKNNTLFREFADRTQFHGLVGEYFEEVYNNIAKIPLGESSWKETVDLDNNIDIICGLAPMSVFMGALGAGGFVVENRRIRKNLNRLSEGMTPEQKAMLDHIVEQSKDMGNQDVRNSMKAALLDKRLTDAQKREHIEYLYNKLQEKAAKAAREKETEDAIQKETDDIVNSSNQADGTVTECSRITTNEIGESEQVPGHIVGWMGGTVVENPDGTKSREGGQPIWQPVGSTERITLKEGEYDPASIQSMPTKDMIDATSEMMREEAQKKAEMESKYDLSRINPPSGGTTFTDISGRQIIIIDKNPNGGWIAKAPVLDEKGNPKKDDAGNVLEETFSITDEDYYDTMQAQLDAKEEQSALQQKYGTKVLDDGRVAVITAESNGEISYDIIGFRGNLEDSGNMSLQEYESLQDYAPVEEEELDDDGLPINSQQVESSNLSESQVENEILSPAGENIMISNEVSDAIGEVNPATESIQEQKPVLPVDEQGNILYHKIPMEDTIADLTDGTLNDNEIDGFIAANKSAAGKLLKKVSKSAPKISTNKAQYLADKKAWQEKVADAQARVDYWNSIDEEIAASRVQPGDKTAEAILSMGEPMNGEELAAMMLGTGRLPILYDSYKKETGGRNSEARGMVGLFATKANGGLSIEEAGEQLMLADQENGTHFFDENDSNAGRNAIIDVLSGARTRGDLFGFIRRNREVLAERERQAELEAYEQTIARLAEASHMTPEEFIAFEENIDQILEERLKDVSDEELKSIFAELYLNENERSREINEVGTGVPQGKERAGSNEGSPGVFGEERSDNAGASERNEERPESDDEIGYPSDGVLSEADAADGREEVAPVGVGLLVNSFDRQGNPIDEYGNLIIEKIDSIEQLLDEDFNTPSRSVQLPSIPTNVSEAIGAGSKPVIIKKNVFEKNRNTHKELTPDKSRNILVGALYSPNIVGQVQPIKRPNYWVAIETVDKNSVVVLEVNNKKDNVEIVGWRLVDTKGLEKMKRQAEREGGQFLIQTSTHDAAAALSTLPFDLSSESKDSKLSHNKQENGKFVSPQRIEGEPILDYAARISESKRVHDAGKEVDTNPTEAQKEAGNYKKGHVKIDGFDITIENPKGSVRSGVDADEKPWSITMNNTYGYIRGTEGVDRDHIDVFLGESGNKVYVVDQLDTMTGTFDEHKVMYGFNSMEEATEAYLSNYSPGWQGLGAISEVSKNNFKKWINSSHRKTKPFVEYKIAQTNQENSDNASIRFREVQDAVSYFAAKHNIEEADVRKYAQSMQKGNLGGASYAFQEIRRKVRLDNPNDSFMQFSKRFAPIREKLYAEFGNIDALREEAVRAQMEERNIMEAARKRSEEEAAKKSERLREFQDMSDDHLDEEYFKAVKENNELRMHDLVNEAARRKGYEDIDSDYQGVGAWAAPSDPGYESAEARRADVEENSPDVNIEDISKGYSPQPNDYFSNLRAYGTNTPEGRESAQAINSAINGIQSTGNIPMVKVYRAVPTEIKEGSIRNADWVTPSKKYAEMHGNNRLEGKYRIIEQEVPANELWWDGNDINEWGFDDGKGYRYKNAKNNRKLNDLITRDDNGEIIPLSKRFNSRKKDVRFRNAEDIRDTTVRQEKIVSEVKTLSDSLHTPVRVVKSVDELPESDSARKRIEKGSKVKGWFDISSGEVVVYLPNAVSVEDARESVFHEVVGHYGLRKMFGQDFDTFLDNVYANVSPKIRKQIVDRAKEQGNILDLRESTEEYLAELAERGFENEEEKSLWQKIKDAFIDMLRKAGIRLGFDLTDNELRYILWRSYQNLESPSIMDRAADVDMQRRLRVGNFRENEAESHYSELKKEADRLKELTGRDVNLGRNEEEIAFMMSSNGADAGTIDYVRDIFARAREEGVYYSGFFDSQTGKIYLCADQIENVNQLRGKWAHENSHLFHKSISEWELEELFDKIGSKAILDVLPSHYHNLSKAEQMDEYLARATEGVVEDETSFDDIINDKEVDEVLENWDFDNSVVSYIGNNLKNIFYGKEENEVSERNERKGKEYSLRSLHGKNGEAKQRDRSIQGETEKRFRTGESTGEERRAPGKVDKSTLSLNDSAFRMSKWDKIREAYQDGMISVKLMQDYLAQKTGKAIPEWMDIYLYENSKSGRSGYRMEQFHEKLYAPLMQEAGRLMEEDRNNGSSVEEAERLLDVYMKAKHGLEERNERMRREAMLKKINSIKDEDVKSTALQEMGERGIRDAVFSDESLEKFRVNLLMKDYSGLIGLVGKDENGNDKSMPEAERYARDAMRPTMIQRSCGNW